jgi:hypothetical protein
MTVAGGMRFEPPPTDQEASVMLSNTYGDGEYGHQICNLLPLFTSCIIDKLQKCGSGAQNLFAAVVLHRAAAGSPLSTWTFIRFRATNLWGNACPEQIVLFVVHSARYILIRMGNHLILFRSTIHERGGSAWLPVRP